jgi:hypothetical protein
MKELRKHPRARRMTEEEIANMPEPNFTQEELDRMLVELRELHKKTMLILKNGKLKK